MGLPELRDFGASSAAPGAAGSCSGRSRDPRLGGLASALAGNRELRVGCASPRVWAGAPTPPATGPGFHLRARPRLLLWPRRSGALWSHTGAHTGIRSPWKVGPLPTVLCIQWCVSCSLSSHSGAKLPALIPLQTGPLVLAGQVVCPLGWTKEHDLGRTASASYVQFISPWANCAPICEPSAPSWGPRLCLHLSWDNELLAWLPGI